MTIPVSSYSEYSGSIINCDGILQSFSAAVVKKTKQPGIGEVAAKLGGPVQTSAEAFAELVQKVEALKDVQLAGIPAQGLNLNASEAA
jgi:NADH-quinone oxidoreductase subunit G